MKVGRLSNLELEVYGALLKKREATTKEISNIVRPGKGASGQASVDKALKRLAEEGCVRRDHYSWPHTWEAEPPEEVFCTLMGNFTANIAAMIYKDDEVITRAASTAVETFFRELISKLKSPNKPI